MVTVRLPSAIPSANLSMTRYEFAADAYKRAALGLPSKCVLDVGAGDGRMRGPIEAAGGEWRGFDLHPSAAGVTSWDLAEPYSEGRPKAGALLLLDVVEHLANPLRSLRHLAEVLETDGLLVLTAPNPRWSRSRLRTLVDGTPACFTESDLELNGHVFIPWQHVVFRLLGESGFRLEEYVTLDGATRWPPFRVRARTPLSLVTAAICRFLERRDPSACGMSYGLLARRVA